MNDDGRTSVKAVVNTELMQNKITVHKLHPEISNALKRQRETSGIDYWKTSSNVKSTDTPSSIKRTGFSKIHSLHLELPDVGFPIITHRLPKQPNVLNASRIKKKPVVLGVDALTRSHSSINLSTNNPLDKSKSVEPLTTPNKASLTDLTCLQFADALLSNSSPRRTGLFGFSVGKLKYMDYLEENAPTPDTHRNKEVGLNNQTSDKANKETKISKTNNPQLLPSIKKIESKPNKPKQGNKQVITQHVKHDHKDSQQTVNLKCSTNARNSPQGDEELRNSNRKSILKQTVSGECEKEKTNEIDSLSKAKCDTTKKPKESETENGVFDPSLCVTITASPPRHRKGLSSCSMSARTDRRSVRFNKSDEVFEFAPSEPICY